MIFLVGTPELVLSFLTDPSFIDRRFGIETTIIDAKSEIYSSMAQEETTKSIAALGHIFG